MAVAGVYFFRSASLGRRTLLVLFSALLLGAIVATGRRAGTLVLLMGFMVLVWYLVPKRPVMVIAVTLPLLIGASVYLAVYWHREYGALAQPARAVRSQFDPTPRDESSDDYRDREKANVLATIELNQPFGVGFGRPFAVIQPLPDLTSFWPLQRHVPHQNLLWLWLKMGVLGLAVILGVWVLALARCALAVRSAPGIPPLPVILICILFIGLAFASVDILLGGTRGTAVMGVALALAFDFPALAKPGAAGAAVGQKLLAVRQSLKRAIAVRGGP
jgi:hypothetical protein